MTGQLPRPTLTVRDLQVRFRSGSASVHAVNGVAIDVRPGEHVAVVGESGSGKSATALSVLRLLPPSAQVSGAIRVGDTDVLTLDDRELRRFRGGRVGMVYQDPFSSLNPVLSIRRQVTEAVRAHQPGVEPTRAAISLLELVGIPDARRRINDYPHQFSGGMRQRVMLAMALAGDPELLIADEPTTALDVTIQAQILDLLREVTERRRMALMLISHDLGVVARVSDRVYVMYAGRVVEAAPAMDLFERPSHPYTVGLLESVPRVDQPQGRLPAIEGQPPDPTERPAGCPFAPRCPRRLDVCTTAMPPLAPRGMDRDARRTLTTDPGLDEHVVACWNPA